MDDNTLEQQLVAALNTDLNDPHWQLLLRTGELQFSAMHGINNLTLQKAKPVLSCLSAMLHDLNAIGWLLERILQEGIGFTPQNQNEFVRKMNYIALDIEMFHVKMLLLLDCLSKAIAYTSPSNFPVREINKSGFKKIKDNWDNKSSGLPVSVIAELFNLPWQLELGDVRNIIAHRPAITMPLLSEDDRIIFNVRESAAPEKMPIFWSSYPKLLCNENAAYFDSYAGAYLGQLFNYLKKLAPHLLNWFGQNGFPPATGEPIPLSMIRLCMQRALSDLQASEPKANLSAQLNTSLRPLNDKATNLARKYEEEKTREFLEGTVELQIISNEVDNSITTQSTKPLSIKEQPKS